nr:hypothetical protein [uncultured Desulfuromonas sp.]
MEKPKKGMIGTAGEYYVCAELCRRNILALPTSKNNPIFDLMASDAEGRKTVTIQVKTMGLGNKQGWRLGKGSEKILNNPNLFVILVNMKDDGNNDYYIFKHDVLATRVREEYDKYINTPKTDGTARKDVDFRWFDLKFFNKEDESSFNNWDILGL